MMLQMTMTFVISVFSVLKSKNEHYKKLTFCIVLSLQLSMALWHIYGGPLDRLKAIFNCIVSIIEFVATSLIFASVLLTERGYEGAAEALGTISPQLMMAAIFVPLLLEVYDSLVMPIFRTIKDGKANGASWKKIIITLTFTPALLVIKMFKVGGSSSAVIGKVGGLAKKGASKTNIRSSQVSRRSSAGPLSKDDPDTAVRASLAIAEKGGEQVSEMDFEGKFKNEVGKRVSETDVESGSVEPALLLPQRASIGAVNLPAPMTKHEAEPSAAAAHSSENAQPPELPVKAVAKGNIMGSFSDRLQELLSGSPKQESVEGESLGAPVEGLAIDAPELEQVTTTTSTTTTTVTTSTTTAIWVAVNDPLTA